ncbi:MAG: glycosyltransferase family 39 protein [Chloroflexi bacterium]|nr:glycosyltransferase family 39 protein [Chloroflexota bacterium]
MPPPATINMRWRSLLLAIFLLALVPRLAVALTLDDPPVLQNDAGWYDFFGRQISDGRGYALPDNQPTSRWPPGYPLFLGGIYKATHDSQRAARVTQALIGALTAVLAAAIARRSISRNAGLAAGVLVALLPSHALYSSLLMSEVLFTFLIMLALQLGVRARSMRAAALAGIVFGAATLVRAQAIVLVIPLVASWAATGYLHPGRRRETALLLGALVATVCVTLAPWTVRNAVQLHAFQPVSTNLGINLWVGNNPDATGAVMIPPIDEFSARATGTELEVRLDARARDAALRRIAHHPLATLSLAPRKLIETFRNDRSFAAWYEPRGSSYLDPILRIWLGRLADVYYYLLVIAALAGTAMLARARRFEGIVLPVAAVVVWSLVSVVFFGDTRYHLPLLPLLAAPAGYALTRILDVSGDAPPGMPSRRPAES